MCDRDSAKVTSTKAPHNLAMDYPPAETLKMIYVHGSQG